VERTFIENAFRKTGISGLVTHMAVYSFPVQLAVAFDIPLVVYGENSAFEYGSEEEGLTGAQVDLRWLRAFGVTAGTTAEDWIDDDLSREDLAPFSLPEEALLASRGVKSVFLGWFLGWDPENSRRMAAAHGFEARAEGARVGHANYVNIDDDMIGVHHHPKWYKFGITRSWDTLSMEIRAGRLTRSQAIERLALRGDETPWDDIRIFCEYLGIAQGEYFEILETFRNREIWTRRDGIWVIDDFLIPNYTWPKDPIGG
jgi:hypothetical protein